MAGQLDKTPLFYRLLDMQKDGAFNQGIRLFAYDIDPSLNKNPLWRRLFCSSFFSEGTSKVFVVPRDGSKRMSVASYDGKTFIGDRLPSPRLSVVEADLAKIVEEEDSPLVYVGDHPELVNDPRIVISPSSEELVANQEMKYGKAYGYAEAWLNAYHEKPFGRIEAPRSIESRAMAFEDGGNGWQKAFSATLPYYVKGILKEKGLRGIVLGGTAKIKALEPSGLYAFIRGCYSLNADSSPLEIALHGLAAEEHRRWMWRTIFYARKEVIAEKEKKGMMVPFEELVADYRAAPEPKRDIVVYDFLDVLGAIDTLSSADL